MSETIIFRPGEDSSTRLYPNRTFNYRQLEHRIVLETKLICASTINSKFSLTGALMFGSHAVICLVELKTSRISNGYGVDVIDIAATLILPELLLLKLPPILPHIQIQIDGLEESARFV